MWTRNFGVAAAGFAHCMPGPADTGLSASQRRASPAACRGLWTRDFRRRSGGLRPPHAGACGHRTFGVAAASFAHRMPGPVDTGLSASQRRASPAACRAEARHDGPEGPSYRGGVSGGWQTTKNDGLPYQFRERSGLSLAEGKGAELCGARFTPWRRLSRAAELFGLVGRAADLAGVGRPQKTMVCPTTPSRGFCRGRRRRGGAGRAGWDCGRFRGRGSRGSRL